MNNHNFGIKACASSTAIMLLPFFATHAQTTIPAQRVSDIATGALSSNPANFTLIDTRLFFTASDKKGNRGVYLKNLVERNGVTVSPTVWTGRGNTPILLKNFKLPVGVTDMDQFTATEPSSEPTHGKVYFHVPGSGLWMTYGKTPILIGKFDDAAAGHEVTGMIPVQADTNGTTPPPLVYFAGWAKKTGQELYCSEGSPRTTRIVDDIVTGTASSNPDEMVEYKQGDSSTVFFRATPAGSAFPQIWDTQTGDLTLAAPVVSSTLGAPDQLVPSSDINGCYYVLPAADSNGVPELWYTSAGSQVQMTTGGANPLHVTEFPGNGDSVIFSGTDSTNGRQLWEANSFLGDGELLNVINPNGDANPANMTAASSEFYFTATVTDTNSQSATYLFVTDGDSSDTAFVTYVTNNTTYYPTNPGEITPVLDDNGNGMVYFVADGFVQDGTGVNFHTGVLWMVPNDGVSSAAPVLDAQNHIVTGAYNLKAAVNSAYFFRLYFARDGGDGFGSEVWVTAN
jgi:ELWxxDGT repeat protein